MSEQGLPPRQQIDTDPDEHPVWRERRVVLPGDLTDEDLALIEAAEVPAEYAYLDAELKPDEGLGLAGETALR